MIEENPCHFYMGVPPGPQRRVDVEDLELRREVLVALGYHGVNLGGEHKKRTGREKEGGL